MIRYADDFVLLCRSLEDAQKALEGVEQWVKSAGLKLHPDKTKVANANQEGFDFLGYHFQEGKRWPSSKSIRKFKAVIRSKTPRLNGQSLSVIISNLNRTTRGWFEYFRHTNVTSVFKPLDGRIRRRLRRILLKRHKKKRHSGLGTAHKRWPNAYFTKQGLFSLEAAHALLRQPARR